jgi:hypothetical protein
VENDQTCDESSHSKSSSKHPGGIALSGYEKAEAFAEILVTQFQLVTFSSVPAVIEMVDMLLES